MLTLWIAYNCLSHEPDIDKSFLSAKDPWEGKYQLLINKRESTGFIEYSNDMDEIYKNIGKYNPNKKRKILIIFDDTIADMLSIKNSIVTELFIRSRKLNIKYNTLFCYENSKQNRPSTNCI